MKIQVTAAPAVKPTLAVAWSRLGIDARVNKVFLDAYDAGLSGWRSDWHDEADRFIADLREEFGFKRRVAPLLTPPDAQHKLGMASMPSFGLTLAHAEMSSVNMCPWRGDCEEPCVVSNGNGRYDSVQRAWLWRTEFAARHPYWFADRLGEEAGVAVRKHGTILFRPDVNSDAAWHRLLPALGQVRAIRPYGYTKNKGILGRHKVGGFTYAYSWNEQSNIDKVRDHLIAGGCVAVVTNRSKEQPVDRGALRRFFGVEGAGVRVADADVTDEWMFKPRTIGDLTAKGKARKMIGKSAFVVVVY